MKARNVLVLGIAVLALSVSGCEYGKTFSVPEAPASAAPTEDITRKLDDQAGGAAMNAAEIRALRDRIDQLERRLAAAEDAAAAIPETQPVPTPETAPAEIVPLEPQTPEVVPPDGGASVGPAMQAATPSILRVQGAKPSLGAGCGAGATVTGNNSAGRIVMGSGPSNFCKITFGQPNPFTAAPICTASPSSTDCPGSITVGTTTSESFFLLPQDVTVNFNAHCSVNYICVQSDPVFGYFVMETAVSQ
ncbi:MAG TPA: hypothetical protein VFX30_07170 [bacterium]|nr:hypothetical protein [bacterium]